MMKASTLGAWIAAALVLGLASGWGLLRLAPRSEGSAPMPEGLVITSVEDKAQIIPWPSAIAASEVVLALAKSAPRSARGIDHWAMIARVPPAELGILTEELRRQLAPGDETLLYAFQRLALHDPRRALELSLQPDARGSRDQAALAKVLSVFAQTRPDGLTGWFERHPALQRRQLEERWLDALGLDDPLAALTAAARLRWVAASSVGEWAGRLAAESSPAVALAQVAALPLANQRTAGLAAVLARWSRSDPKAATTWLLGQKGLREAPAHWKLLLAARAEQDARAAADLVASGATGLDPVPLLKPVLRAWGEKDLAAARAWIERRPAEERTALLVELLPTWARNDPAKALDFAVSSGIEYESLGVVREALRKWRTADPAAATQWLRQLPAGLLRDKAVDAWVNGGRPTSVEEARQRLELLRGLTGGPGKFERRAAQQALQQLASLDPDAGLAWANGLPPSERTAALRDVVQAGATRAPDRMAALLQSLPLDPRNNDDRNQTLQLFHPLAHSWAQRDVLAAANWAAGLPDRMARAAALNGLALAWTEQDPQAAWRWALSQGPQVRNDACREVLREWTGHDAAAALAAVRQLPPEGQVRQLPRVLGAYAGVDPAGAASLAEGLPESPARQRVLGEIAAAWKVKDAVAAGRWIERNRAAFEPGELARLLGP